MIRTILRTSRFYFSALTREVYPTLRKQINETRDLSKLKPYLKPQNLGPLTLLSSELMLPAADRLKLLLELDRMAKLQTDHEINMAAIVKKRLSLCYMEQRDINKAVEEAEDALKLLRMMDNPHPIQLGDFMHHLAEAQLAREPTNLAPIKLIKESVQLFEEGIKLQPDNQSLVLHLLFCYNKLCSLSIVSGDYDMAETYRAKGQALMNKQKIKDLRAAHFNSKVKCIILNKKNQYEKIKQQCINQLQTFSKQPVAKVWYLNMLVQLGHKEHQKDFDETMAKIEKEFKPQQMERLKKQLEMSTK